MHTGQHDFAHVQRKFDRALSELAHLNAGGTLSDEDEPTSVFNQIVTDLCSRKITSRDQLEELYKVLDYLMDVEGERVEAEIESAVTPFERALFALAGHVLAARRRQAGNA